MSDKKSVHIIAPVGLTGSGKSTVVDYLADQNIPKIYGGGLIVQGVIDQGLEPTQKNEKKYREEMRAKHGKDVFIKMCIEEMNRLIDAGQRTIVFDGLYTWTEYKALKHAFPNETTVIATVTPKHLRYQRLAKREFRPLESAEVDQRDWAEIEKLEKGGPIAIADYFVLNDGDLEQLHRQIDAILRETDL